MLLVDVEVLSVGRKYQFHLEEQVLVDTLITELTEIICQKEQCSLMGDQSELCLCSEEQKRILDRQMTLAEQGVSNADRLLLV